MSMQTERASFQLHHTGIKTNRELGEVFSIFEFQLHHTGIKTRLRMRNEPQSY